MQTLLLKAWQCGSIRMVPLTDGPTTLGSKGGGLPPPAAMTAGAVRRSRISTTLRTTAIRLMSCLLGAGQRVVRFVALRLGFDYPECPRSCRHRLWSYPRQRNWIWAE